MADYSSFTSKFRVHKEGSQDPSNRNLKRPRESLVCTQCRRSKLKCDKARPCGSCVKKGEADSCSYSKQLPENSNDSGRHGPAEERLNHLESLVKELIHNQSSSAYTTQHAVARPSTPPNFADDGNDAGPGTRLLVGATHWSAMLDEIHELKAALGLRGDPQNHDPTFAFAMYNTSGSPDPIYGLPIHTIEQIMAEYLPSRDEMDRALGIYFNGETFIMPFLHTHQFQRQYRDFWMDASNINPLWLSILFSICYLSSCIGGASGSFRSAQNEPVIGSMPLHIAAAQCLVLGGYNRPQQYAVEALLLYAHCKALRSLDPSRDAGSILSIAVRLAYEMGYHRDPDHLRGFSVFEGEMRRRFWALIKQMDWMVNFQLGLPTNVHLETSDTKSPRHLLDSDFDEDTTVLPASRPEDQFTGVLWFIVKDRIMPGFAKVCRSAFVLGENQEPDVENLDKQLIRLHNSIPDKLRPRLVADSITDSPLLIMQRLYVEFIHLKSVCILHRKYMARGRALSTKRCLDAGTKIVTYVLDVHKEFQPGGRMFGDNWLFNGYSMNDFFLGAMVLCLLLHVGRKRPDMANLVDETTQREVSELLERARLICVNKSRASRDARRVARAIWMTLHGTEGGSGSPVVADVLSAGGQFGAMPSFMPAVPSPSGSTPGLAGLSLQSSSSQHMVQQQPQIQPQLQEQQQQLEWSIGDEMAFGTLDPFNFIATDFDFLDVPSLAEGEWAENSPGLTDYSAP